MASKRVRKQTPGSLIKRRERRLGDENGRF
jgi:hypothetical protein